MEPFVDPTPTAVLGIVATTKIAMKNSKRNYYYRESVVLIGTALKRGARFSDTHRTK